VTLCKYAKGLFISTILYTENKLYKGERNMKNKKTLLGLGALVIIIAAFALIYGKFSEKPVEGSKAVTIEVINSKEESTVYELQTDAEYLEQAMKEAEGLTFEAEEGPYGLAVSSINGEVADFNVDAAYWGFFVNGEYCNYGVSEQPVNDGDAFQIVYTVDK
jgi:hypothetical protein